MKQEDTKRVIADKALELFSERGYEAVSVGEIAKAVGIKAPSLYNHYPSKQAIFEAIVEQTAERYDRDTSKSNVHVSDGKKDVATFEKITEEDLIKKVREIFYYSLHDEKIAMFRKMMTMEQFRSRELASLYTERFVERLVRYHSEIFRGLIKAGVLKDEDPLTLALAYVSPIITLIGVCDREPQKESECLKRLDSHVALFFRSYNIDKVKSEK